VAQINQPRYEQFAGRVLGVKGPGTLTYLENSLFATLPVDTSAPFEFWQPQGIDRYVCTANQPGVAGQYGYMQVFNNSDGKLLVIEDHFVLPGANTFYWTTIQKGGSVIGGAHNAYATDVRAANQIDRSCTIGTTAAAPPFGNDLGYHYASTTNTAIVPAAVVLEPGDFFMVMLNTVNFAAWISISYHLRTQLTNE